MQSEEIQQSKPMYPGLAGLDYGTMPSLVSERVNFAGSGHVNDIPAS